MSKALIQAQHLHRYYADTHAVNNISIELHKGDILGLLGPNGAGKSSCLQILCGVLAPGAGQILVNGIDLLDSPKQAKQLIGYLPDRPPLYTELTVDEYLNFAAHIRHIDKKQITELRNKAKQRCGLEGYGSRLIGNLSKGYQQRIGIAQAIIHQPPVIILDEPTVGLDPLQIREIRSLIAELGEQHGVILSTHVLPEVQAVCSRVQMLHQGQSVLDKSMHELKQNEQLILRLQQSPSINELSNLKAVETAEQITEGHYLLFGNDLHHSLADISQHCVDKGWGLLEMSLKESSLEQIFLNLSAGECDQSEDTNSNSEQVA